MPIPAISRLASLSLLAFFAAPAIAAAPTAPAVVADDPEAVMVVPPAGPATMDYETMFALASDCSVALSVLEENGATLESEPTDWMNVLMNLGERLGRDPYIEYLFRQTEISALLEVEPVETSSWVTATADECALLLPAGATAHAGASSSHVSRASS